MRNQHPTQALTYYGLTLEMGVALYKRPGGFPSWAIVFHPQSFSAKDVWIYRIVNDSGNWVKNFHSCALKDLGPLIGVLRVSDSLGRGIRVPSLEILDMFMSSFPPGKDENDARYESLWTCNSWVIRVLKHFETVVKLPCRTSERLLGYVRGRGFALKTIPPRPGKIQVIPLNEVEPSSSISQAPIPILSTLRTLAVKDREMKGYPPIRKPIMTSRH